MTYDDPYRQRPARDRTGIVALVIAVAALVGMVVAVPTLLPPGVRHLVGLGPERLAPAPAAGSSESYAFVQHQPGDMDAPVGYDPCRPIRLRVNPDGGPSYAVRLVKAAMSQVEQLTGLRFSYVGTTDERPRWKTSEVPVVLGEARAAPVLVSWAKESEVKELAGDVAGIGGSLAVSTGGGPVRYVTGGITLDADVFGALEHAEEGGEEAMAIVLHEFGHLVGLAHVRDPDELMNAENLGILEFGPGDKAGLARVGSVPCR